jgi:hypothetical protein
MSDRAPNFNDLFGKVARVPDGGILPRETNTILCATLLSNLFPTNYYEGFLKSFDNYSNDNYEMMRTLWLFMDIFERSKEVPEPHYTISGQKFLLIQEPLFLQTVITGIRLWLVPTCIGFEAKGFQAIVDTILAEHDCHDPKTILSKDSFYYKYYAEITSRESFAKKIGRPYIHFKDVHDYTNDPQSHSLKNCEVTSFFTIDEAFATRFLPFVNAEQMFVNNYFPEGDLRLSLQFLAQKNACSLTTLCSCRTDFGLFFPLHYQIFEIQKSLLPMRPLTHDTTPTASTLNDSVDIQVQDSLLLTPSETRLTEEQIIEQIRGQLFELLNQATFIIQDKGALATNEQLSKYNSIFLLRKKMIAFKQKLDKIPQQQYQQQFNIPPGVSNATKINEFFIAKGMKAFVAELTTKSSTSALTQSLQRQIAWFHECQIHSWKTDDYVPLIGEEFYNLSAFGNFIVAVNMFTHRILALHRNFQEFWMTLAAAISSSIFGPFEGELPYIKPHTIYHGATKLGKSFVEMLVATLIVVGIVKWVSYQSNLALTAGDRDQSDFCTIQDELGPMDLTDAKSNLNLIKNLLTSQQLTAETTVIDKDGGKRKPLPGESSFAGVRRKDSHSVRYAGVFIFNTNYDLRKLPDAVQSRFICVDVLNKPARSSNFVLPDDKQWIKDKLPRAMQLKTFIASIWNQAIAAAIMPPLVKDQFDQVVGMIKEHFRKNKNEMHFANGLDDRKTQSMYLQTHSLHQLYAIEQEFFQLNAHGEVVRPFRSIENDLPRLVKWSVIGREPVVFVLSLYANTLFPELDSVAMKNLVSWPLECNKDDRTYTFANYKDIQIDDRPIATSTATTTMNKGPYHYVCWDFKSTIQKAAFLQQHFKDKIYGVEFSESQIHDLLEKHKSVNTLCSAWNFAVDGSQCLDLWYADESSKVFFTKEQWAKLATNLSTQVQVNLIFHQKDMPSDKVGKELYFVLSSHEWKTRKTDTIDQFDQWEQELTSHHSADLYQKKCSFYMGKVEDLPRFTFINERPQNEQLLFKNHFKFKTGLNILDTRGKPIGLFYSAEQIAHVAYEAYFHCENSDGMTRTDALAFAFNPQNFHTSHFVHLELIKRNAMQKLLEDESTAKQELPNVFLFRERQERWRLCVSINFLKNVNNNESNIFDLFKEIFNSQTIPQNGATLLIGQPARGKNGIYNHIFKSLVLKRTDKVNKTLHKEFLYGNKMSLRTKDIAHIQKTDPVEITYANFAKQYNISEDDKKRVLEAIKFKEVPPVDSDALFYPDAYIAEEEEFKAAEEIEI